MFLQTPVGTVSVPNSQVVDMDASIRQVITFIGLNCIVEFSDLVDKGMGKLGPNEFYAIWNNVEFFNLYLESCWRRRESGENG